MTSALQRLPIESARPMVLFAVVRVMMVNAALVLVLILGLPYEGRMIAVLAGVALPWSLFNVWLARRAPESAVNPLIAAGDLVVLAAIEAVEPELYGVVRFMALFFLAVHAHFQGDRIGLMVGAFAVLLLGAPAVFDDDLPVDGDLLIFYEGAFAAAALGTVALVGRFRTEESASRLRAREISRRTLRAENDIRRRLSQSLHDGPVQELISMDMMLVAARNAANEGDLEAAAAAIEDARAVGVRSVNELRDEMLDLGPFAYEEFSFSSAVERCSELWERRYDLSLTLDAKEIDLPSDVEGELFRITQEAVANAARHGRADKVTVALEPDDGALCLRVSDDGRGFDGVDPLAPSQPGHIGLAMMRERTEMLGGELSIDSSEAGTTVTVRAPLPRRLSRRRVR
jgi:signal transduction histidine kinase